MSDDLSFKHLTGNIIDIQPDREYEFMLKQIIKDLQLFANFKDSVLSNLSSLTWGDFVDLVARCDIRLPRAAQVGVISTCLKTFIPLLTGGAQYQSVVRGPNGEFEAKGAATRDDYYDGYKFDAFTLAEADWNQFEFNAGYKFPTYNNRNMFVYVPNLCCKYLNSAYGQTGSTSFIPGLAVSILVNHLAPNIYTMIDLFGKQSGFDSQFDTGAVGYESVKLSIPSRQFYVDLLSSSVNKARVTQVTGIKYTRKSTNGNAVVTSSANYGWQIPEGNFNKFSGYGSPQITDSEIYSFPSSVGEQTSYTDSESRTILTVKQVIPLWLKQINVDALLVNMQQALSVLQTHNGFIETLISGSELSDDDRRKQFAKAARSLLLSLPPEFVMKRYLPDDLFDNDTGCYKVCSYATLDSGDRDLT